MVCFHRNLAVVMRSKHRQVMAQYFPSFDGTGDGESAVFPDMGNNRLIQVASEYSHGRNRNQ